MQLGPKPRELLVYFGPGTHTLVQRQDRGAARTQSTVVRGRRVEDDTVMALMLQSCLSPASMLDLDGPLSKVARGVLSLSREAHRRQEDGLDGRGIQFRVGCRGGGHGLGLVGDGREVRHNC